MKRFQTVSSIVLVALCVLQAASAEEVNFKPCPATVNSNKCAINEVKITPCPEATEGRACTMYTKSNVRIVFDFTPEFAAYNLTANVYWKQPLLDLPFAGLDRNACNYTECPVELGKRQTYEYNLTILKTYPAQAYSVMWKLDSNTNESCCFIVEIVISKKTKPSRG